MNKLRRTSPAHAAQQPTPAHRGTLAPIRLIYPLLLPTIHLFSPSPPPPPPPSPPPLRRSRSRSRRRATAVSHGTEEGEGPGGVVQAGQVRRRQAEEEEVEQGQAKGEGEQRGAVRPGHLRQAAHRDQRVSGSQGYQGPDGEGAHQDGLNPLQPADLHQGDKHLIYHHHVFCVCF
ncbi:hypothetical protein VPH35_132319 [Triticum aestivum]